MAENKAQEILITVDAANEGLRIDKLLAVLNSELSRTYIQKLIVSGQVLVNNKQVRSSYCVAEGDAVLLIVPETVIPDIAAEDIPLDIVFEDDDVLVVNKPKNMVVHPAAGNYSGTLVNAIMFHCRDRLSGINGILRPGIVHRIDKDTTGLLVVCKNDRSHQIIAEQLKAHTITRRYEAICTGILKEDEITIDRNIGRSPSDRKKMAVVPNGKNAVTHVSVIKRFDNFTHISCRLETGRTHQIRVHMSSIGHPLLGDEVYCAGKAVTCFHGIELQGQCLHACVLGFIHPSSGEYMEFNAPLPKYFQDIISL